jgi:hypothetical protein
MHDRQVTAAPDDSAVRVALWRALHVEVDSPPHVFEDEVGLKLAAPGRRMAQPSGHEPVHAALPRLHRGPRPLHRRSRRGTSCPWRRAVRHPRSGPGHLRPASAGACLPSARVRDRSARPSAWKRQRLVDLGFGIPSFLRLVPVDFEAGDMWWERLAASGFDSGRPAVVASTGVSMYLTIDAIAATLRQSRRSLRAPRSPCRSCFRSSWRTRGASRD